MAYAVTAAKDEPLSAQAPGNRRRVAARLAGDSAYTNGNSPTGTLLPPALFGLQSIDAVDIGLSLDGTRLAVYDSTNGNITIFSTNAAPIVETATASQASKIFPVVVWGI